MSSPPLTQRKIRICYFNNWATNLEVAASYVGRVPTMDLSDLVAKSRDSALMTMARLDCDWYAENVRCLATLAHPTLTFLPAWVCGKAGVLEVARAPREPGEERWLVTTGHNPQLLGESAGKVFELLARTGVRLMFYAFDEASRFMPVFGDIAPYLDLLIHDERPLDQVNRRRLKPTCLAIHRSWVANVVPFTCAFNETPEEKIVFLGSQIGLTEHRSRQIAFLKEKFKDRFTAILDHSLPVGQRVSLNRYKVGLCPEGGKFTTPAMAETHTDRPFWSGCLGLVVVSEDSKSGRRLEALHAAGHILRYGHGSLKELADACELALTMPHDARRRVYDYFNRHETVGTVVTEALASAAGLR